MHSILSLSLFLALPPFSFALPAPSSPPFDITWYVTSFEVLDGSATNTPSYASFTFVDPRPEYHFNISCFGFPSSGDSVFSPRMRRCGSAPDNVHVRITDGEVQFRRSWQSQSGEWLSGIATQGTYWNEGEGGNATSTAEGKLYTRTTDWAFPVTSIVG
ncbi:hypothetical protein BU26DRAFT_559761 [Trematosphaeria pertusa]|uniref:AA1-like domain-containing protein n=1 Tax=Trematosphaeria pertusa TaxID=390896 RepID=A0A6A6IZ03_9PLEO|nr:uncharacterized protein BU26DRAFT_559761 [Trematosphaeria pertusa]KAF2255142.1 hypothetical protein BU26DRAFT_559761 [Trematosphaeria pertusa]